MPSKLPEALVPVASGPNHDSSHSKPAFLALFCFVLFSWLVLMMLLLLTHVQALYD
jgi:hypothetical protein